MTATGVGIALAGVGVRTHQTGSHLADQSKRIYWTVPTGGLIGTFALKCPRLSLPGTDFAR